MNDQNHLKPRRVSRWWAVSCERLSSTRWLLVSYWTVSIRRMILQLDPPPFQFHWPNYHCKTPARCHNHQSTVGKSTWIWGGFLRPSGQSDDIWLHLMTSDDKCQIWFKPIFDTSPKKDQPVLCFGEIAIRQFWTGPLRGPTSDRSGTNSMRLSRSSSCRSQGD